MSLTSELKNSQSSTSRFMRTHFLNIRRVVALSRGRMGEQPTLRSTGTVPYSLLGQAIDYRLRFYFPQDERRECLENLVAYMGAAIACGISKVDVRTGLLRLDSAPEAPSKPGRLDIATARMFFLSLRDTLDRTRPGRRRLEQPEEDTLLRYCIVLAAFDEFFRAGFQPNSPLLTPQPKSGADELLAVAEPHWVDDLRGLSWGFFDQHQALLHEPVVLNPTFTGSGFIGGADADFIIGGCLVDIKTTINPLKDNDWIYQVLGYTLLDWNDRYGISEVAVYFARQQFLLKWSLEELIAELTGGTDARLPQLRQQWRAMLAGRLADADPEDDDHEPE